MATSFLDGLNPAQRKAVEAKDGPVLVIAGPGSGKTRVLTSRVAYLLDARKVPPYRVMAVTFTNKAAREMRERLNRMAGAARADDVAMGTFHSICARLLRRDAPLVGVDRNYAIFDADDQVNVVKAALAELNIDEKKYKPAAIHAAISNAKNELIRPDQYRPSTYFEEIVGRVYERYNQILRANNALDFDDLLMETVRLLQENAAARDRLQDKYLHVLVDEFQDTNLAQYALVKLISGKHRNLFCVGDPDQCLPAGTLIRTPSGDRPIEALRAGDTVVAAAGRGEAAPARITRASSRAHDGEVVRVVTRQGLCLRLTDNHIVFARLGVDPAVHYVYLMYRRDLGYRIGVVKGARSDGESPELQLGLRVRGNQEVADRIWVLRVCSTRDEAFYWEAYYAFQYGIPTTVFHVRGRRMRMPQSAIDQLYQAIPTDERAQDLLSDLHMDARYPHYIPKAKLRHVVNLRYFGDQRRWISTPWNAHRVSICSSDPQLCEKLAAAGYHPRNGKRGTWRVEFSRIHAKDALAIAEQLGGQGELECVSAAFLVSAPDGLPARRFSLMPASHLHPTMVVAVHQDGRIVTDEIVSATREPYRGRVYDLDVAEMHNYAANGVVVHNSIYAWRGADYRNVLRLQEDFADLAVIPLEQNYRSTQTILDAAMAVIKRNPNRKHIQLFTERGQGPKIVLRELYNEDEEAQYVVDTIAELTAQRAAEPGEIAVMYRMNAQSRAVEDAFVRAGMPYRLVGATRFYARKEIKDVLAYLRIVNNPADAISLKRVINVPPRGIGDKTFAQLEEAARENGLSIYEVLKKGQLSGRGAKALADFSAIWQKWVSLRDELSVGQLFDQILTASGYRDTLRDNTEEGEERWANVMELRNVAGGAGDLPLADFLNDVALVSETDNYEESAGAPTLLTLHAAKGLEFRVVFLIGLEDGVLPHSRSLDDPEQMAEERRLMYVGVTRAKDRLYLLRAFRRTVWGASDLSEPSRFLRDLPKDLVDDKRRRAAGAAGGAADGEDRDSQAARWGEAAPRPRASGMQFKPGDRVYHQKFGDGLVLRSVRQRDDEEVEVFFDKAGMKRLSATVSGLKKV